ncbi:hypothetical protein [Microvirga guangxiensis]|uniref:hypothetical protein n=1 Tax=Microvirga guangxiensis TaxID=549386 RepID=UPI001FCDABE9|nr:hypothetical protein [Microvirga guangxiensis]
MTSGIGVAGVALVVCHTTFHANSAAARLTTAPMAPQIAASTYGGPAGAAAFAAWYTNKKTGDLDHAIRGGVIAGAASAGYANTSAMPSGTVGEVAKKALFTGAVGGVAFAAAGGNDAAVCDAFGEKVILSADAK